MFSPILFPTAHKRNSVSCWPASGLAAISSGPSPGPGSTVKVGAGPCRRNTASEVCKSCLGQVLLISDHEWRSCSTSLSLEQLLKFKNVLFLEILSEITWQKYSLGSAAPIAIAPMRSGVHLCSFLHWTMASWQPEPCFICLFEPNFSPGPGPEQMCGLLSWSDLNQRWQRPWKEPSVWSHRTGVQVLILGFTNWEDSGQLFSLMRFAFKQVL